VPYHHSIERGGFCQRRTLGLLFSTIVGLTGCRSVGPTYTRPPAAPSDDVAKGSWWEIFGDPQLNDLETQAFASNQNLKAAAERVVQARASAKATRANLFPTVSADASLSRTRTSGSRPTSPGGATAAFTASEIILPIDASYEVDLFGRIRRSIEAGDALVQASVADYENVLLALKSDVAEYYVMLHYIDGERASCSRKRSTWRTCAIPAASPAGWTSLRRRRSWRRRSGTTPDSPSSAHSSSTPSPPRWKAIG
jgi:hypothetical protein